MPDDVFYAMAHWRLQEQVDQVKELNSRLIGVFAGATALLVVFVAFQDFGEVNSAMKIGLAAAAAAVYVLLVVMTFVAFFDPSIVASDSGRIWRICVKSANSTMRRPLARGRRAR